MVAIQKKGAHEHSHPRNAALTAELDLDRVSDLNDQWKPAPPVTDAVPSTA
jgi:hypothetical protein